MVPMSWQNALPSSLETMEAAGYSKILVPIYHVPEDSKRSLMFSADQNFKFNINVKQFQS
jgi:hypothetical protein